MKIELKKITVDELTKDYLDNDEQGVIGYGGKLDIAPHTSESLFTRTNNEMPSLIR